MPDSSLAAPSPTTAAFLRSIADASGDGPASYNYVSSVILPLTGWRPEEFIPRLLRDLGKKHNQSALERAWQGVQKGSYSHFILSLTTDNGKTARFSVHPRPISGEPAAMLCAIAPVLAFANFASSKPTPANSNSRDFPEINSAIFQKLTGIADLNSQRPPETSNAIFRMLEIFPAYVLLIDRKHTIRFCNLTARKIFGKGVGRKCYEVLRGLSSPCAFCPPFGLLTDKAVKIHEWASPETNTAFQAYSYPFEFKGSSTLILQIGLNITAGVRARHALDLSEQRYRSIAENLTMGLALISPRRTLVTLNPRMEEWFGEKAVRGASIVELLQYKCCDGNGEGGTCVFQKVLNSGETQEKEFRLVLNAGGERIFRLLACPILTRGKQVRAIVLMLEDVTDDRNLASRIQQVRRLEALGSLAGGIAHEINQPLSALHLYASGMQMLIEQGGATTEQVLNRLSLILAQAERIRQIISHMRALVMQEENQPATSVSVSEAVNNVLSLVGAQLREHAIQVSLDIPRTLPQVAAEDVQLEQVVINLLTNAMHALDSIPPQPKMEKTILVSAARADESFVILRVSDNGPGVGTLHSRVFDPFFSTKENHQGMGLGLSIVHAFVTSWGGSIEAADNPEGRGAVFSVRLPIYSGS